MKSYIQSNKDTKTVLQKTPDIKKKPYSKKLTIFEMTLFSMFGAMMFISKIVMEFLPNIHLLAMFTVLLTVVYRKKALIPIYIYVLLNGIYAGFAMWWVPYLYVWTVLWGAVMLLPLSMPDKVKPVVYPIVCCVHGALFGILYAPAQAVMYSFSFEQTVAWIISGLPYDALHSVGDFISGLLVYPLSKAMIKLDQRYNS